MKNATSWLHFSLRLGAIFAAMRIIDPKIVYIEGVPVVYYMQEMNSHFGFYWSELEPGFIIPTGKTARRRLIAKARSKKGTSHFGFANDAQEAELKITIEILERQICGES